MVFAVMMVFLSLLGTSHPQNECVILLHGLLRSSDSFKLMEKELRLQGYNVINVDYETRRERIEDISRKTITQLQELTAAYEKVHFVTHSMGGILLRVYLSENTFPKLGRVVMLGPPNKGSEVVDYLKDWEVFEWVNGPAGKQLGTDSLSVPRRLGPVHFELGVIAGDWTMNWINSLMIPGADDGKVSVSSTKIEGMVDHIVLHTMHPLMMRNEEVIEQTVFFLKNGHFRRP